MIFKINQFSPFVLTKANGDRLGTIKCTKKQFKSNFNSYDEINFTTYLYNDNIKNDIYDSIKELVYVEVPEIGKFIISQIKIHSEGSKFEYKECTAFSAEICLGQKYLEEFSINLGTVESIDGVSFYNLSNPNRSLLHLVLDKFPDWEIGHIDNELYVMQRCFEITRQDVYSFLTTDVSEAFGCVFEFDTIHYRINAFLEKNIGSETNIYISYNNLAKNIDISSSIDDIKTCITITGADDLNLREVNMGYDRIYNIDYFHTLEYMSQSLYDSYTLWKTKWNNNVNKYEQLVVQYQEYYRQIHYLESEKMPDDPESTDWTLYGLNPLTKKLESYEQKQSVMIKYGQGDPSHKDYKTMYLPCFNEIGKIKKQITLVEEEIKSIKSSQSIIFSQMEDIISSVSMQNNFTTDQLNELSKYIREDELSSDNYVVTDTMTDSERIDMLHEMLEYGRKELERVSQPSIEFSMDMANLFVIPEFNAISDKFNIGNYIHCYLRDDYIVKLRILSITYNLFDNDDFSVTFGNIAKVKNSNIFEDITNALKLSQSVSSSVSFNVSNWNKANTTSTEISNMLSDGLLSAGKSVKTSSSDILIDDRGMIVSNKQNSSYPNDTIFIGGGQILFSDDGLKTIKTALGRVEYTKKGTKFNDFGLLAQFVIAGYIAASVVEGNEIIGGTITGTDFNNGNGTFHVDSNGNLVATSATVKGKIQADSGYIGGSNGFTIISGKLYSGSKSSFTSTNAGVYIGTDGISLGVNSPFHVNSNGELVAKSGTIGGAEIGSTYLKASNGNWQLNHNGYASFTGAKINGVDIGSSFGGINYGSNGTYGNFSYGFSAGHGFALDGGAWSDFKNLVVDSIEAKKVLAEYITASEIAANYATIGSLDAANAEINNLKSASINVNRLTAGSVNGHSVSWQKIAYVNDMHLEIDTKTISGINVNSVSSFGFTRRYLYVMADDSSN